MGNRQLKSTGFGERIQFWLGKRTCFKVKGDSMNPLIQHGDVVFAEKPMKLKSGDIVIANHPFKKSVIMIKQIKAVDNDRVMLESLNPKNSTDSRQLGLIRITDIVGRVTSKTQS